jgi:hypothetical protein
VIAGALKFVYLQTPVLAPDLEYFINRDTIGVIAGSIRKLLILLKWTTRPRCPASAASCMSQAGRKLTTNTQGAAHGDGSTKGGDVSKSRFGPGNEHPLPYAAGGNGIEVFPGSVSAWANGS